MEKIKTLEDLRVKKQELIKGQGSGDAANNYGEVVQIKVGMGTSGIASGSKEVMNFMSEELNKRGIAALVTQTGDMGYSYAEPTIEVKRPGESPIVFGYVTIEKADEIIEKFIKSGELVDGIIPVNYESVD